MICLSVDCLVEMVVVSRRDESFFNSECAVAFAGPSIYYDESSGPHKLFFCQSDNHSNAHSAEIVTDLGLSFRKMFIPCALKNLNKFLRKLA